MIENGSMKIGFDEFQIETIICEIDGEDCDECCICSTCPKAIEHVKNGEENELNYFIDEITPSEDRITRGGLGMINPDNTIVQYKSPSDIKTDGIFSDFDTFKKVSHGYEICTPIHYPLLYSLQQLLNLGVPEYYMLRDITYPCVAVYQNAAYVCAPVIGDDD
jgi:hypothetical protein